MVDSTRRAISGEAFEKIQEILKTFPRDCGILHGRITLDGKSGMAHAMAKRIFHYNNLWSAIQCSQCGLPAAFQQPEQTEPETLPSWLPKRCSNVQLRQVRKPRHLHTPSQKLWRMVLHPPSRVTWFFRLSSDHRRRFHYPSRQRPLKLWTGS
jgi:hypothetical protein